MRWWLLLLCGSEAREERRYGIAMELAYPSPKSDSTWSHPTTLCVALANLEWSTDICRRNYRGLGTFEPVVITYAATLPKKVRKFLDDAKVRIRDIPEARRPTDAKRAQELCVHVVRMFEYDVVAFLDVDSFLPRSFRPQIFDWLANGHQRLLVKTGGFAPINAGFFMVTPDHELTRRLDASLKHGYDPKKFWQDSPYLKPGLKNIGTSFSKKKDDWSFVNANSDQGLLLHLVAGEPEPLRQLIFGNHSMFDDKLPPFWTEEALGVTTHSFIHFAGQPKPWLPLDPIYKCHDTILRDHVALLGGIGDDVVLGPRNASAIQAATFQCCCSGFTGFLQRSFWSFWHDELAHDVAVQTKTDLHSSCHALMHHEFLRREIAIGVTSHHPPPPQKRRRRR